MFDANAARPAALAAIVPNDCGPIVIPTVTPAACAADTTVARFASFTPDVVSTPLELAVTEK
jgi:hypothetical protein